MPYPNDQGLDITFVSSFNTGKPSIASSTGPEIQLLLVHARRPPSLLGGNSAAPSRRERFQLRYDSFSFRFPMGLPGAPPNLGFLFRLDWTQSRRKEQQHMTTSLTETNAGTPNQDYQRPQSAIAVVAPYILIMCL